MSDSYVGTEIAEMQCPQEEAGGCPVLEKAKSVRLELSSLWETLAPVMQKISLVPAGQFTYENFQWAYLTVISRVFSVEVSKRYAHGLVGGDEGK